MSRTGPFCKHISLNSAIAQDLIARKAEVIKGPMFPETTSGELSKVLRRFGWMQTGLRRGALTTMSVAKQAKLSEIRLFSNHSSEALANRYLGRGKFNIELIDAAKKFGLSGIFETKREELNPWRRRFMQKRSLEQCDGQKYFK